MTYPEFFWADQYIHETHESTTMVGAGGRGIFKICASRRSHRNQSKLFTKKIKQTLTIYYVFKWMKTYSYTVCSFASTSFFSRFYLRIIRCIVKSSITASTYFLLKHKWKKKSSKVVFWAPEFGRPNWYSGFLNDLNTSLVNVAQMFS